ncbi:MAG: RNA polymerase sigma factor RpoD/SigA [Bacilli bacterium]|nr:RNA polymerase sigma factor RpoD/SigA [Bacilli bacterium]
MITNNDESIKKYLADIRKTKPLSLEEEQILFKLLKNGNNAARNKLIYSNMRFVLKVAMQYKSCNIPLTDLINEGAIGLSEAVDRFDPTMGYKFISFAVWWIKAYITKAINEKANLVRIPANKSVELRKALKENSKGHELPDEIKEIAQFSQTHVSFDNQINNDSKTTYSEILKDESIISPENITEINNTQELVNDLMCQLPDKEKTVIQALYGINNPEPQTLRKVASSMNISHERIRQLRDQALKRIRKYNNKELLQDKKEAFLEAIQ